MSRLGRRAPDLVLIVIAIAVDLVVWNGDRELGTGTSLPWLVIPALVIMFHVGLWWRHRRPVTVFAAQVGFAVCCAAVPDVQPFAGLFVALFVVASRLPTGRSIACLVITLIPFGLHAASAADAADALQLLILWIGLIAAVWGVGRYVFDAAERDRRLRDRRAREAVEAERRRLARDLHDTISHSVTTMIIQAAAVRRSRVSSPQTTQTALEIIERYGTRAMTELHQMLGLLDPAVPEPRLADISTLIATARETGRRISFAQHGSVIDIGGSAETTVYRIVQEGLTNALKYAGPEAAVAVDLRWTAAGLRVELVNRAVRRSSPVRPRTDRPDDGAAPSSGSGLAGLRARVEAAGGTWRAEMITDGFRLQADLPAPGPPRRRFVAQTA